MACLLELERGDGDRLEGRAIIYAYCVEPVEEDEEDQIVAMFFSTHPTDFVDRFGAPEGGLADLAAREADARKKISAGASALVPIYGAPIEIETADLQIASEDVIYTGQFSDPQKCVASLNIAAHLYVFRYSEQLLLRSGLKAEPVPADTDSAPPTYEQISAEQMSEHLQSRFISPIMHALEDDQAERAMRVAHDFITFCGSRGPLTADAYALAEAVRSFSNERQIPLLYKYFEKILAITNERFEDAARLRDEINAIKAGREDGSRSR